MIVNDYSLGKRFASGSRPPEDVCLGAITGGKGQNFGVSGVKMSPVPDAEKYSNKVEPQLTEAISAADKEAACKEADIRWQRIIQNDLENIPMALFVAWAAVFSNAQETVHIVCLVIYSVSRALHTFCYAYSLQPWRTYVWTLAILVEIIMALNALVCVFLNPPAFGGGDGPGKLKDL